MCKIVFRYTCYLVVVSTNIYPSKGISPATNIHFGIMKRELEELEGGGGKGVEENKRS